VQHSRTRGQLTVTRHRRCGRHTWRWCRHRRRAACAPAPGTTSKSRPGGAVGAAGAVAAGPRGVDSRAFGKLFQFDGPCGGAGDAQCSQQGGLQLSRCTKICQGMVACFRRQFSASCALVPQKQFNGPYPLVLSNRISTILEAGRWPMSSRKFSNFSHRLLIVTPAPPPDIQYCLRRGFWILARRLSHTRYSVVPAPPCVVLRTAVTISRRHPHDLVQRFRGTTRITRPYRSCKSKYE
jgi:hypothetical protein